MKNKLCNLLKIDLPIIQGGMVWCSGWKLASAVSNSGGLGVIGAGSMYPKILDEHLIKLKNNCSKPYAVNLPLLYPQIEEHIGTIINHKVPVVITSAGNPAKYTSSLKQHGITVLHVVANSKFTLKALEANVDGIIAEGFEAGGHNGKEETTTMCLIPQLRKITNKILVAAGGISSGESIYAAMALGADGVQIGSRFASSTESSAHQLFKEAIVAAKEGDTSLTLKELTPVRLLKSPFFNEIMEAYKNGSSPEKLRELLGKGRAKKGIFEGDLVNGELEIGQVSAQINSIQTVQEIIDDLKKGFNDCSSKMKGYTI